MFYLTEKKMAEYSKKAAVKPKPLSVLRSLEEKYVAVMKKLQFGRLRSVWLFVALESKYWRNIGHLLYGIPSYVFKLPTTFTCDPWYSSYMLNYQSLYFQGYQPVHYLNY